MCAVDRSRDGYVVAIIDDDEAIRVCFDACFLKSEVVGIGLATDREKNVASFDLGRARRAVEGHRNAFFFFSKREAFCLETYVDSFPF